MCHNLQKTTSLGKESKKSLCRGDREIPYLKAETEIDRTMRKNDSTI